MRIDRVCFYLDNAARWRHWFVERLGWRALAARFSADTLWETVCGGGVTFELASPQTDKSPIARYLRSHPPGVGEIALVVADPGQIAARADCYRVLPDGSVRLPSPAGVTFTLRAVARETDDPVGWAAAIDHVVLNVAAGAYAPTIAWFERVLGFERQQHFKVQTPRSGLVSQVLVHPESGLRLPINAPTSAASQIQEFLDRNCGPGVQHIALATADILKTVRQLRQQGLSFLQVPEHYYTQLPARQPDLQLRASEWQALESLQVLADCPQAGETLLQIFTRPLFERPTFFLEIIERRGGADGFGEGNFRALFEAIEWEQLHRCRSRAN